VRNETNQKQNQAKQNKLEAKLFIFIQREYLEDANDDQENENDDQEGKMMTRKTTMMELEDDNDG